MCSQANFPCIILKPVENTSTVQIWFNWRRKIHLSKVKPGKCERVSTNFEWDFILRDNKLVTWKSRFKGEHLRNLIRTERLNQLNLVENFCLNVRNRLTRFSSSIAPFLTCYSFVIKKYFSIWSLRDISLCFPFSLSFSEFLWCNQL